MKPAIPDIGTVIRLEKGNAVVRMKHEGSCYKCGAAAMGLCKGGLMQELTVRNSPGAGVGDTVKIGLIKRVQYRGFILAYVAPAAALVLGIGIGHAIGDRVGLPSIDIFAGFASLIVVGFFSLNRLKRLDSSNSIEIVSIRTDPWVPNPENGGTVPDLYISNEYACAFSEPSPQKKGPESPTDPFMRIFPD